MKSLWVSILLLALAGCRSTQAELEWLASQTSIDPVFREREKRHAGSDALLRTWGELEFPDGLVLKQGEERVWHKDGTLAAIRHFDHGEQVGEWHRFWPDGSPRSFANLDEESLTTMRFWHETGVLAAEGPARGGVREGAWRHDWPSGLSRARGEYLEGRKHGPWEYFDESGRLSERCEYRAGKRLPGR
ncbi:MAG: hypothetical protein AAF368_20520, partial [Planctomycetota bacterium]